MRKIHTQTLEHHQSAWQWLAENLHLGRLAVVLLVSVLIHLPTQLLGASLPASVTLSWDPNPESDIASYQLKYGTTSGVYPGVVAAGTSTTATASGLTEGATYYFVVTATNTAGLQSAPCAEIAYQIPVTPTTTPTLIPRNGWTLRYVDSQEAGGYPATAAFDGSATSFWHTAFSSGTTAPPHEIQIDLGATYPLAGFRYLPRQDNYLIGNIAQYEFYVSADGNNWGAPVATGTFANNKTEKEVLFAATHGRYIRLRETVEVNGWDDCACAELNVLQGAAVVIPNQAPVASSSTAVTAEDTPRSLVLTASDPDGNPLTYSLVSQPAHGTLTGTAPNVTYTPAANYNGADSFSFKASDGTLASAVATVSLSVTAVNDAPAFSANPLNLTATANLGLTGQLAASDVDAGAALTFSKVSGPAWLAVAANGALSGTPLNANVGSNTFVVGVSDGIAGIVTATVNITVASVNVAPVFTVNPIALAEASEGTAYNGQSLAGLAVDNDSGDAVTYAKVSGPAWLSVAANGELSGTPAAGSAGLNTFIVSAIDKASASGTAELRIQVSGTLPLPWVSTEIGSGQLTGSATYQAGTFIQSGSGLFNGTSDNFRFTYQTLSGDGEISSQISALQNTGTSSSVGVMIRDSLAANSRYSFMGLTGSNTYRWMRRSTTGGPRAVSGSSTGTVPNTWVKLVRKANVLTAYKSTNGTTWTKVGSNTITMAANCYIGLVVASGSNTTLNTSQFSSVTATP